MLGPLNAAIARRRRQFNLLDAEAKKLRRTIWNLQQTLYTLEKEQRILEGEAQTMQRELLSTRSSKPVTKAQAIALLNSMTHEELQALVNQAKGAQR
jgi:hypothetical protein